MSRSGTIVPNGVGTSPPKKLGTPKGTPSNRVKTLFVPPPPTSQFLEVPIPLPRRGALKKGDAYYRALPRERGGVPSVGHASPKFSKMLVPSTPWGDPPVNPNSSKKLNFP